jgi:hypothetical protein
MHRRVNAIDPVLRSGDATASSTGPTTGSDPGNAGGGRVAGGTSRGKKRVIKSKKFVELEAEVERMEIESEEEAGNADEEKEGGGASGGTGKGKGKGKVQGKGKGKVQGEEKGKGKAGGKGKGKKGEEKDEGDKDEGDEETGGAGVEREDNEDQGAGNEGAAGEEPKDEEDEDEEEEDEVDEDGVNDEKGEQTGGGVSVEDEEAQRAILSLNKIDFRDPPVALHFGKWNDRPVIDKHVKQLLAMIRKQGVRAFNPANRLPVIAYAGDLAPSCITTNTNLGPEVPMLELSAAGKAKGQAEVAGGRHRYHAWKLAFEQGRKIIDKHETQLASWRDKPAKGPKGKETRENKVAQLKEQILAEQVFLDAISVWGIVVYDACE